MVRSACSWPPPACAAGTLAGEREEDPAPRHSRRPRAAMAYHDGRRCRRGPPAAGERPARRPRHRRAREVPQLAHPAVVPREAKGHRSRPAALGPRAFHRGLRTRPRALRRILGQAVGPGDHLAHQGVGGGPPFLHGPRPLRPGRRLRLRRRCPRQRPPQGGPALLPGRHRRPSRRHEGARRRHRRLPEVEWLLGSATRPPSPQHAGTGARCRRRGARVPSGAQGRPMAYQLLESAEDRWGAITGPKLVALGRPGATFRTGVLVEGAPQNEAVAAWSAGRADPQLLTRSPQSPRPEPGREEILTLT